MPCEGLKLTIPRSFWETSMHTLGTMLDMINQHGDADVHDTRDSWCNCAVTTRCASWILSSSTEMCTSTPDAEIFWLTVTHWLMHSYSWLFALMNYGIVSAVTSAFQLFARKLCLQFSVLRMRNFTWNRFPVKNMLIDSLLTPIVESTYLQPLGGTNSKTWKMPFKQRK